MLKKELKNVKTLSVLFEDEVFVERGMVKMIFH